MSTVISSWTAFQISAWLVLSSELVNLPAAEPPKSFSCHDSLTQLHAEVFSIEETHALNVLLLREGLCADMLTPGAPSEIIQGPLYEARRQDVSLTHRFSPGGPPMTSSTGIGAGQEERPRQCRQKGHLQVCAESLIKVSWASPPRLQGRPSCGALRFGVLTALVVLTPLT